MKNKVPADYANRIKELRQTLGITQTRLAELLDVSFASINRWENEQAKPSQLGWQKIERAEILGLLAFEEQSTHAVSEEKPAYNVNLRSLI